MKWLMVGIINMPTMGRLTRNLPAGAVLVSASSE